MDSKYLLSSKNKDERAQNSPDRVEIELICEVAKTVCW